MCSLISEREGQALLAEWQKTLRLQDWDVTLVFKRYWDLEDGQLSGRCRHSISQKNRPATNTADDTSALDCRK